jgi:hypothetical protein
MRQRGYGGRREGEERDYTCSDLDEVGTARMTTKGARTWALGWLFVEADVPRGLVGWRLSLSKGSSSVCKRVAQTAKGIRHQVMQVMQVTSQVIRSSGPQVIRRGSRSTPLLPPSPTSGLSYAGSLRLLTISGHPGISKLSCKPARHGMYHVHEPNIASIQDPGGARSMSRMAVWYDTPRTDLVWMHGTWHERQEGKRWKEVLKQRLGVVGED